MPRGVVGCAVRPMNGEVLSGQVSAVFAGAAHLRTGDVFVTLGTPVLPSHPYSVATPQYPRGLSVGMGFSISRVGVQFSNGQSLAFAGMDEYAPLRDRPSIGMIAAKREALNATLDWVKKQPSRGGFHQMVVAKPPHMDEWNLYVARSAHASAARVIDELRRKAWANLCDAAEDLAGLGEGLTPSGDDWLNGFLASLWFQLQLGSKTPAREILIDIANRVRARTTPFSAFLVGCSARGLLSEPVSRWLTSVYRGDPEAAVEAAKAVAAVGHSSGMDCLAGLVSCGKALLELGQ